MGKSKKPTTERKASETPAPEKVVEQKYVVAAGKTITSLRGILIAGTEVSPNVFRGGEKTFENLVARGYIDLIEG